MREKFMVNLLAATKYLPQLKELGDIHKDMRTLAKQISVKLDGPRRGSATRLLDEYNRKRLQITSTISDLQIPYAACEIHGLAMYHPDYDEEEV